MSTAYPLTVIIVALIRKSDQRPCWSQVGRWSRSGDISKPRLQHGFSESFHTERSRSCRCNRIRIHVLGETRQQVRCTAELY